MVWQLRGAQNEDREKRAPKLIAVSFLILAVRGFESIRDLVTISESERSVVGIVVAVVSIIVMPTLAFAKKRLAGRDEKSNFAGRHCRGLPVLLAVGDSSRRARAQGNRSS